ncbi:lipopolysaccharide biosynthesis protein [Clostridium perfringens]|uniref:lipopolysaccharide biosynthesis protein n=1 Tax=Clostridium perfringens TaxID=1502 RepID=UPI0013E3E01D|nr:oligosaccharide flippase family protein [Clostridium perfringens]ELC8330626.1 oligosaccharide flippase family protein [Clostridium perfringens]NGT02817.1 oligosaccharide flippase family protein [Clostridium perfringens]
MIKKVISKYQNLSLEIKASLWFMICSVVQKGISFITVPIFTRIMTTSDYGEYSVFLSWESILAIFVTLNLSYQVFNNGMVKYKGDKDGYTTSMVGLTLVTGLLSSIIYLIFNNKFNLYIDIKSKYMFLMLLDMIFTSINGLWIVRKRYEFKYRELTIVTLINVFLNPTLGILFVINFDNKVLARILSIVISNGLVFIILFIFLLKKSAKLFNFRYWKYALRIDLPLIPHYLSLVLLNNSDRIMINKFCGMSYTAFYSVAYNVSMIMQIVITSINSSFNPWLYQQLEEKKYSNICKKTNLLLIVVAFSSLIPAIFGPEVLSILGSKEYAKAVTIIPPLTCCVFITFAYTLFSNIELFFEKSNYIMLGSLGATVINLILNFIFIQIFGYEAAAYTTLTCYLLLALFHYMMMKKVCNEQKINEQIFDIKFIFLLTIIVILLSFGIMLLYNFFILRYIFISILIIFIFMQRKSLLTLLKSFKS